MASSKGDSPPAGVTTADEAAPERAVAREPGASPDAALRADARAVQALESVPHILEILCRTTGMGFAAVARVTDDRWIACASLDRMRFGLGPGDELDIRTTLCREVRACREAVVIPDTDADPRWCDHPAVRQHGFRSYVSVPIIRRDGSFFGTLCAIDPAPRELDEAALAVFRGFAELTARELDDNDALIRSRRQLRAERATARLREEFVAVLGHDLRSPLASLSSGLRLLEREGLGERAARTVVLMQATIGRMNALIDNLLDLARGRLGQGIAFEISPCETELHEEVRQVVGEIRAATGRSVELGWQVNGKVRCDRRRMGQLVSNLVSNAVTHGDPGAPVRVEGRLDGGLFILSVENRGEPIPPEIIGSLFRPFFRGGAEPGSGQGLGLGLYIAREIARAHGGSLEVDSTDERTRFTLSMPA